MSLAERDSLQLLAGLKRLLADAAIASPDEIAGQIATTDQASPAQGARMVARAWCDPAYRDLMLRDGSQAAEAVGIPMRGMPPLGVLENTPDLHHLMVCTLCSCYPRAVLGYPPYWYKSAAFRARAVREPRALLLEWGTRLPPSTAIRVVDSTADCRWMVLPCRPAGTTDWPEADLARLVDEGDMTGVTVPSASPRAAFTG